MITFNLSYEESVADDPGSTDQLVEAIHSPFTNLLNNYSTWEEDYLMTKLKTLDFVSF